MSLPATTLQDVLAFAEAIYENPGAAPAILERVSLARRHQKHFGSPHPVFGDGTLSSAARLLRRASCRKLGFDDPKFCRAVAQACSAWAAASCAEHLSSKTKKETTDG
ncbi:MAG: hypothetical protein AAF661_00375 [Pseudomonadota bacterium]